ncbi:Kelch-like ECH-associated protein 1 [Echinococcus granulosus]|uniref:Kelch ECH associated protein 1 like n=1 Tax=Echinococcus granulosus TaxID=6210 RepID=A0A068WW74_ECHGR|nr:Kelch-like ECH-associated protein 1 [Echinococcus granulosus]CDS21881.1 kelch ECH associated protein 1 like [Echinococcus granulosus]
MGSPVQRRAKPLGRIEAMVTAARVGGRRWMSKSRIPCARHACVLSVTCVVAIGHFIYAVGGYDSHSQLRSMERLNTEQNVWEYMTSMLHPRSALSASVLDGKIWVFGGYDGNEFLSSVEVYDPSRDTWTRTTVMPCGKSGHAVVTSREPVAAIAASATTSTSPSVRPFVQSPPPSPSLAFSALNEHM